MIRNIPPLALIPLVILWFGIDEAAKLFLVSLGVFFPVYINRRIQVRSAIVNFNKEPMPDYPKLAQLVYKGISTSSPRRRKSPNVGAIQRIRIT